MNITHIVRILESYIKETKITDKITAITKALIVIKAALCQMLGCSPYESCLAPIIFMVGAILFAQK